MHWQTKEHIDRAMPIVGHYPEVQELFSNLDLAVEMFALAPVHGTRIMQPDPCAVELALFRTMPDIDGSSFEQLYTPYGMYSPRKRSPHLRLVQGISPLW
jgi:hypothetical protein